MSKLEYSKEDIIEMQNDINWWANRFKAVARDNRELQQRIDKAIEYINKNAYDVVNCEHKTLLNIEELLEILGGEK